MTRPTELKETIDNIVLGEVGTPTIANRPHINLENNIDNLIDYLDNSPISDFDIDVGSTSGTTLAYKGGKYLDAGMSIDNIDGTLSLSSGDNTYYIYIDVDTTLVTSSIVGYPVRSIPLYYVDVVGGVIDLNTLVDERTNRRPPQLFSPAEADSLVNVSADGTIQTVPTITTDGIDIFVSGNVVWHAGNDGSGSGLDADWLDGQDSSYYINYGLSKVSANDTTANYLLSKLSAGSNITLTELNDGANESISIAVNSTGLDADTVDGLHASSFSLTSHNHAGVYLTTSTTSNQSGGVSELFINDTGGVQRARLFYSVPDGGFAITPYDDAAWQTGREFKYSSTLNEWQFETELNAVSFNTTSKREYKENIKPFDNALALLKDVDVVSFNFKKDENKETRIGFIADDTHALLSGTKHNKMDIPNVVGVLLKAVKELQDKVDKLDSGA